MKWDFRQFLGRDIVRKYQVVVSQGGNKQGGTTMKVVFWGEFKKKNLLACQGSVGRWALALPGRSIFIPKEEYAGVYDKGEEEVMGEIQVLPVANKYPYQQGAADNVQQEDQRQPHAEEGPSAGWS